MSSMRRVLAVLVASVLAGLAASVLVACGAVKGSTTTPPSSAPHPTGPAPTSTSAVALGTLRPAPLPSPCPVSSSVPSMASGSYCGPPPHAGNGDGPDGVCTGREASPPCAQGAVVGQYYAYTVPGGCDGRVIFAGGFWDSELPAPSAGPSAYGWVRLDPSGELRLLSPSGSVGFRPSPATRSAAC